MSPGFTSPPNPKEFQAKVWALVRLIPKGKVATYGQIASFIQSPPGYDPKNFASFAPRWVGGAMASCPEGIPWHRVVNSQGMISLRGAGGGKLQKELLLNEGVQFDEKDRIDLRKYRWTGPDE
jgi:methylated-DNA-protein-cysteine methyltransferase related protein